MITSGKVFSWLRSKEFFAVSEMKGRYQPDTSTGSSKVGSAKIHCDQDLEILDWRSLTHPYPHFSSSEDSLSLSDHLLPTCLQVAGEFKYHPECFACMSCKVIIEDGDAYALVQHTTLYW